MIITVHITADNGEVILDSKYSTAQAAMNAIENIEVSGKRCLECNKVLGKDMQFCNDDCAADYSMQQANDNAENRATGN